MADTARNFRTEVEPFGHFSRPVQDGVLGRDGVESRVALDCSQSPGVLVQKVGRFGTLWIEIPYPALE